MQKRLFAALAMAGSLCWTTAAWASNHLVSEKNKQFSSSSLKIKTGDTVEFRNEDTVYHNVFSLSDALTFDLGNYGPSEVRKVTFAETSAELRRSVSPRGELCFKVKKMVVDSSPIANCLQ